MTHLHVDEYCLSDLYGSFDQFNLIVKQRWFTISLNIGSISIVLYDMRSWLFLILIASPQCFEF